MLTVCVTKLEETHTNKPLIAVVPAATTSNSLAAVSSVTNLSWFKWIRGFNSSVTTAASRLAMKTTAAAAAAAAAHGRA